MTCCSWFATFCSVYSINLVSFFDLYKITYFCLSRTLNCSWAYPGTQCPSVDSSCDSMNDKRTDCQNCSVLYCKQLCSDVHTVTDSMKDPVHLPSGVSWTVKKAWGHSGEGSGCPCFNTFGQVTGIKKWSKDSFMLKPSHCYYGKEGQLSKK